MGQEGRVHQRLSVALGEVHPVGRIRGNGGIHAPPQQRPIPGLQGGFLAGEPLQGQPGGDTGNGAPEGFQHSIHGPVRLFHRQFLMEPALGQGIEHRVSNLQHQAEPVFSYHRKVSFPHSFSFL